MSSRPPSGQLTRGAQLAAVGSTFMRVVLNPWGFAAGDISAQVMIWHGRQDHHVPPSAAQHYAQTIPESDAVFLEHEGHFSLIERHAERIVRQLVQRVIAR